MQNCIQKKKASVEMQKRTHISFMCKKNGVFQFRKEKNLKSYCISYPYLLSKQKQERLSKNISLKDMKKMCKQTEGRYAL